MAFVLPKITKIAQFSEFCSQICMASGGLKIHYQTRGGWIHILNDPDPTRRDPDPPVCNYALYSLANILTNINNEFESNQQNDIRICIFY